MIRELLSSSTPLKTWSKWEINIAKGGYMEVGTFSARQATEYKFSSPYQGRRMANLCCIPIDGHEDVFLRRPTRGQLFRRQGGATNRKEFQLLCDKRAKDNGDAYNPGVLMRNKVCVELSERQRLPVINAKERIVQPRLTWLRHTSLRFCGRKYTSNSCILSQFNSSVQERC